MHWQSDIEAKECIQYYNTKKHKNSFKNHNEKYKMQNQTLNNQQRIKY